MPSSFDDLLDTFDDGDRTGRAMDCLFEDRQDYATVPWLSEMVACRACTAREEALRVVPGRGPLNASIALIGQNPSEDDDEHGVAFVGRPGAELNVWLGHLGLDAEKLLITNAVKCHTTRNRKPRPKEMATCRAQWLVRELCHFSDVSVLIPLGRPALETLLGTHMPSTLPGAMEPWWTWVEADELPNRQFMLVPLPHPAYLLRSPQHREHMYADVLPTVKGYLTGFAPVAYERSK